MTWEDAGLISEDAVINIMLRDLASHGVQVDKLQDIKKILERK